MINLPRTDIVDDFRTAKELDACKHVHMPAYVHECMFACNVMHCNAINAFCCTVTYCNVGQNKARQACMCA